MSNRSWAQFVTVVVVGAAIGCGDQSPSAEDVETRTGAATQPGGPHLLWRNADTGQFSAWLLSGTTVTGVQNLDATCGGADGCAGRGWMPVDSRSNSVLWHNHSTGFLSSWKVDTNGHVTTTPSMTWTCGGTGPTSCGQNWRPIGRVNLRPKNCTRLCGVQGGLVWHNRYSGEVSVWMVATDGVTVTGATSLSWLCGVEQNNGAGCSDQWVARFTADFDGDGNGDLIWYNRHTGQVSAWLIKDTSGTIKGSQTVSWTCGGACATDWLLVAAGDGNADGHPDVLWWNGSTGEVQNWLLDGSGNVTGTRSLSRTCPGPGCNDWWVTGYIYFAAPQPPEPDPT